MSNKIQHIIRAFFDRLTSSKEDVAVQNWIANDDNRQEEQAIMQQLWDRIDAEPDEKTLQSLRTFHANRDAYEAGKARQTAIIRLFRQAAIFVLPLAVGAGVWFFSAHYYFKTAQLVEFYVPQGETDSCFLPDGTKVMVNGGSTMYYPKQYNTWSGNRDVYLQGEANFRVAHNKKSPFIVHAGDLNIQAVGTRFNVKAYAADTAIIATLEEGCVKVYDNQFSSVLQPNEQIVYSRRSGKMNKDVVNVSEYVRWTLGDLDFTRQTLRQILTVVGKRYGVRFDVDKTIDLSKQYNMSFMHDESLKSVMTVLTQLLNNTAYEQKGQTIKLFKKRKEEAHSTSTH